MAKTGRETASSQLPLKPTLNEVFPVWRGDLLAMPAELYTKWSSQVPEKRAVIVYSSMWHSTEKMAFAISDGLRKSGMEVKLFSTEATYRSEVMTEIRKV